MRHRASNNLQTAEVSSTNLGDFPPAGTSIGERIKTGEKRHRIVKQYSDVSDDSDYEEPASRKRRRRTSTTSISSASTDKYRELRDKNNEASRKSRLNRKEKERDLRISLEDAERRNRELRAESDALEKSVLLGRKVLLHIVINSKKR